MIWEKVRKIKKEIFDNIELNSNEFLAPFEEVWWKVENEIETPVWVIICTSCRRKMIELLGDKKYDKLY
jgi:hypothetical protein